MDLPSYTPPVPVPTPASDPCPPRRSIQDLRAQIIANGSVMRPIATGSSGQSSDDHIELVVAQLPAPGTASTTSSSKRAFGVPEKAPEPVVESGAKPQHYACLLRRAGSSRKIRIIYQSVPKDSVEEALEALLEYSEKTMHEMIRQYGRRDDGNGCCVM